ncbi:MAG: hypothetical protein LBU60_00935 [Clostridiales bacterium]|nr:hypothetical protein [Clostridiales bacterium]
MSKSRVTAHSRKRHNLVFDFIQEFINQPDKYKDLNSYDNLCGVAIKMSDYFYEYFETRDFEDNGLHKHLEQYKVLYLDEDKISYQDVSMSF